uniref:Uncharacterized protein n=1 Tax=Lepeophtheirus salmonis TaxID=72036 RepID=A0A0K2VJY1_LEPSM
MIKSITRLLKTLSLYFLLIKFL